MNYTPNNADHFQSLLDFYKTFDEKVVQQGIEIILYGSAPYLYFTGDEKIEVQDLDFLASEKEFEKISNLMKDEANVLIDLIEGDSLKFFRDSVKLSIHSLEQYKKEVSKNYSTEYIELNGVSFLSLSEKDLLHVYLKSVEARECKSGYLLKLKNLLLHYFEEDFGLSHIVELREYNSKWREIYSIEKRRIFSDIFDGIELHHVGSTSIPGLCAKPIIDMALLYKGEGDFDMLKEKFIKLGYRFREDLLPSRKYFVLEDEQGVRYFSISAYSNGDKRAKQLLEFKKNLLESEEVRDKYAEIKKALEEEGCDREEYMQKKNTFIIRYS